MAGGALGAAQMGAVEALRTLVACIVRICLLLLAGKWAYEIRLFAVINYGRDWE